MVARPLRGGYQTLVVLVRPAVFTDPMMGNQHMRLHAFVSRMTLASVLVAATFAMAQDGPPSGKIWVESKTVALGVGVS